MFRKLIVNVGLKLSPSFRQNVRKIPFVGILLQKLFRYNFYANNKSSKVATEYLYEAIDSLEFRVSKLERQLEKFTETNFEN